MPRIQLLLDQPFTELLREGWGCGKASSACQFASFQPAYSNSIAGNHPAGFAQIGTADGIWKLAGTGVITLQPIHETYGPVDANDPQYHGWAAAEVTTANNMSGGSSLALIGSTTIARIRQSKTDTLIGLLATAATTAILATWSGSLALAWQTANALKANEGFAVYCQPVRTYVEIGTQTMFGYMAFTFGGVFALRIDLHGFAILAENIGSDSSPNWVQRKTMDLGGAGLNLRENFRVTMIPLGGYAMVFRFGNAHSRVFGLRPSTYDNEKQFVYEAKSGSGSYYDAGLNMDCCVPSGKLSIALQTGGTDYRFTPYKLRYPTDTKTCYFTSEAMDDAITGATPTLTPYGYASGYTSGGQGTMTMSLVSGDTGGTWAPATDTKPTPKLQMTASSDGIYSPSFWYWDGDIAPVTQVPPWSAYDASAEWKSISFRRTLDSEQSSIHVALKEENRVNLAYRRGGPVSVKIDGGFGFDGYFDQREPVFGVNIANATYEGLDMWARLKVPAGRFQTLDGKTVASIVSKLLQRAGFPTSQISIESNNLAGITFDQFQNAQSLQLFTEGATVEDALRDIQSKFSVQFCDGIRIRWVGYWRVYLDPTNTRSTNPDGTPVADPMTIFYSDSSVVPASLTTDAARWAAGWFKITSDVEIYSKNPEYNAAKMTTVDKTDDSGQALEIIFKPAKSVTTAATAAATQVQEFEGRIRTAVVGPPTITAISMGDLQRQGRFFYDKEQRKGLGIQAQAEFQKGIDADQECVVLGRKPGDPKVYSFGVFRIEEINVEITADDYLIPMEPPDPTAIVPRSWQWTGGYQFHYLRPTTATFDPGATGTPIPMFSTVLPPASIYNS